ncbi:MAG: NAD-dependent dehydratase [Bacteroidetes bacterium HGW-Bacteroidetes-21]|jgi:nucleoside-diphosphate-sugar epimerase|nr:MAG: NAD-dependent dehydratase [Bacteroidetes bacterium HGW-Bacteroidetes-21]
MKVLVTGANGFLSGHVIHELIKSGYHVRTMMRNGAKAPALEGLVFESFFGQITQENDVNNAVRGMDIVIHVAADTSQKHRHVNDYFPVNVNASRLLIQAVKNAGCRRMIYVSTANTMGYGSKEKPGNEEHEMSSLFKKSGYALSKSLAEKEVLHASITKEIDAVIVNPTFMIGPMDFNPHSGRILKMGLNKKLIFCPPGGKNFVDVRDVAKGIIRAMEKGQNGERYLLAGDNLSFREFFQNVKQESHQKPKIIQISGWIIQTAGFLGSILKFLGFKSELSFNNSKILCIRNFYENKKAVNKLNMTFTNTNKTISDYLVWKNSIPSDQY